MNVNLHRTKRPTPYQRAARNPWMTAFVVVTMFFAMAVGYSLYQGQKYDDRVSVALNKLDDAVKQVNELRKAGREDRLADQAKEKAARERQAQAIVCGIADSLKGIKTKKLEKLREAYQCDALRAAERPGAAAPTPTPADVPDSAPSASVAARPSRSPDAGGGGVARSGQPTAKSPSQPRGSGAGTGSGNAPGLSPSSLVRVCVSVGPIVLGLGCS